MQLNVTSSENLVNVTFGEWLIPRIKTRLVSQIARYKLNNWDSYLTKSSDIRRLYDKQYTAADIIIFASNNLVCTGVDGDISITFNNNVFVPGFDRLRLSTIIKTINYGTLDVKQCSIFTDTLNYFSDNIHQYVNLYYGV